MKELCLTLSNGHYLNVHETDEEQWDYTFYDSELKIIDGGQFDMSNEDIKDVVEQLIYYYYKKQIRYSILSDEEWKELIVKYQNAF